MQIVPTHKPTANRDGESVVIDLGDSLSIKLAAHAAMYLAREAQREASDVINLARYIKPDSAQVIAFPVHATRMA